MPKASPNSTDAPAARSRWSSLVSRGGGLMDRLTGSVVDGVKEGSRSPLLKQALDARERGNIAAAFHLLAEDFGERPDDIDVASALWDVALTYERSVDAVAAVASLIRRYGTAGSGELAIQYWSELCTALPEAWIDPAALARIVPQLIEQWENEGDDERRDERKRIMLCALRAIVHPDNEGLSTGVAMRTAELAREIDPETALCAARVALECDDLHEAKRQRLSEWVAELDPSHVETRTQEVSDEEAPQDTAHTPVEEAAPSHPAPPHPALNHPLHDSCEPSPGLSKVDLEALREKLARVSAPCSSPSGNEGSASGSGVEFVPAQAAGASASPTPLVTHVEIPRYADVKVMSAKPTKLDDVGLCLDVGGGRRGRVEYAKIQAVVMARVAGIEDEPVQLIDLLLNWNAVDGAPLRLLRLREDAFDPRRVVPGHDDRSSALQGLLGELLERTGAVSLPDPDALRGGPIPTFDSLAEYERDVLQIGA